MAVDREDNRALKAKMGRVCVLLCFACLSCKRRALFPCLQCMWSLNGSSVCMYAFTFQPLNHAVGLK